MARTTDEWRTGGWEIKHEPRGDRLVDLGEWAVPDRLEFELRGSKDFPAGKRWPNVSMRFEVRDGAAVCVEFRVVSVEGDRAIRTGDLRVFDLDELATHAFTTAGYKRHEGEGGGWVSDDSARQGAKLGVRKLVNAGYENPRAELLDVARVYLNPESRGKPTDSVMAVVGYESRATASRRVKRAREEGLIPPPGASVDELDAAWRRLTDERDKR